MSIDALIAHRMRVSQGGSPPQIEGLVGRELEIARFVYDRGSVTAREVEDYLPDRLHNSTIRTTLKRLVRKGVIRRRNSVRGRGQRCIYLPVITLEHVRREAVSELIESYFDRSAVDLALEVLELIEPASAGEERIIQNIVERGRRASNHSHSTGIFEKPF